MSCEPEEYDIKSKIIHLKGNLRVNRGDKLFIFGDTKEFHYVSGYYLKETIVGINVWPEQRISQSSLIKEYQVRAVETLKGNFFVRTKNGYFFQIQVTDID